jgi:hypothetical protein
VREDSILGKAVFPKVLKVVHDALTIEDLVPAIQKASSPDLDKVNVTRWRVFKEQKECLDEDPVPTSSRTDPLVVVVPGV